MIKFWFICVLINLFIFFLLKDLCKEVARSDPRFSDRFKDLSDDELMTQMWIAMFVISLSGPLFWVYGIIKQITK